ncbi:hypothetical protein [Yoonia sp.]|uniref:hypothetical protein n=1 Tax=Yoonia sp. TaxID=2212373 RepID=UPI0025FA3E37|nr:hypothetical protein [Yoonia sp.]
MDFPAPFGPLPLVRTILSCAQPMHGDWPMLVCQSGLDIGWREPSVARIWVTAIMTALIETDPGNAATDA